MIISRLLVVVTAAGLFGWNVARADCMVGETPSTSYVGTGPTCKYSTIQDAITAVSTTSACPAIIYVTNQKQPWNEVLTVTDRSFSLIGTSFGCLRTGTPGTPESIAAVTTPQATISGAGLNAPVITISGNSNVMLQALEIA
jgi:hypothetical protein